MGGQHPRENHSQPTRNRGWQWITRRFIINARLVVVYLLRTRIYTKNYIYLHQFLNKFNDFILRSTENSENSYNLKVENLGYGITLIYSCLYNKKILFLSYSLTFLTLIVNARHVGCTVSLSYILCVFKYVTPGIFISLDKNRFI